MKFRFLIFVAAAALVLAAETGAQLYQRAVTQERAAGNLDEAIKLYQRVAREFASDRPLAAKALVQAARCYEKLGQDQSVKLYEQVTRDYGDQTESAKVARERLAALTARSKPKAAGLVARQIPMPSVTLSESDGNRIYYVDYSAGGLISTAMDGSQKKLIFSTPGVPGTSAILVAPVVSRDGNKVAFKVRQAEGLTDVICVAAEDGAGFRRVLDLGRWTAAKLAGWSHDGRYLLAFVPEANTSAASLVRISIADGAMRKLVNGTLPSPQNVRYDATLAQFSPNGKWVAYSKGSGVGQADDPQPERGVYLVSADGVPAGKFAEKSGPAVLLDWTPDGNYVLYSGRRNGIFALYAQRVADGRAQGEPILVKQDSGKIWKGFMRADGTLLYSVAGDLGEMEPVILGAAAEKPPQFPVRPSSEATGAAWSKDLRRLAYTLTSERGGEHKLVIRQVDSGDEHEMNVPGGVPIGIAWSADSSTLYEVLRNNSNTVIQAVTQGTGAVRRISDFGLPVRSLATSNDGEALLVGLYEPKSQKSTLLRYELSSGTSRELASLASAVYITQSPDGAWIAALNRESDGTYSASAMRPGGAWTRLASMTTMDTFKPQWTADGKRLLFAGRIGKERAFWSVAVADGKVTKLTDITESDPYILAIRADGNLALVRGVVNRSELWELENFLPKLRAGR